MGQRSKQTFLQRRHKKKNKGHLAMSGDILVVTVKEGEEATSI